MSENVSNLYRTVLGREPNQNSLQVYINEFNSGVSLADIRSTMAHSDEARGDINGFYEQVLGREADEPGLEAKESELADSSSLNQIRSEIGHSPEAAGDIQLEFGTYLRRDASSADISFWEGQLGGGSATLATMIQQLATSPESYSRSPAVLAALEAMYQQVLGRGSDAGSLAYTQGEIANGVPLDQIRQVMAHSDEAASHIQNAFQSILGSDASSADISFWQSQLGGGSATLATMIQQLATSPESYSRSPAVLAALEAMYQQVLGRGSDAGSLAYCQGEIANGVPLDQIRQVMAHSDEAASHIQNVFQSILGRDASSADISFWEGQLGGGSATLATMIQQLATSPESYSRSPAVLAALEAMYQQVLGRGSDAGSLAYYQGQIANGVPVDQIRQVMAHSDEAASHIQGAFQSVLGRDASAADLSYWEGRLGDGSATLATMIQQLANSPESYSRSPAVLAALEAMYQQVLGRGSDAGSLAYYQGQIANGVPVDQIRQVMAHSDEAASHIQNAFQSILGRDASSTDISFWEGQLGGGSATLATMIQQLAESSGSYSSSSAVLAALEAMYQQVLGRGSDAGSLAYIQGEIANGVPVDQIRQVMAHSDEAASHIQGAFQSVLGRDASAVDLSYWEGRLGDGSATLATMIQQLANSPESYSRSPAVLAALEAMYQQVLGRGSDAGSLAYYQGEIANGVPVDQIRQVMAHSDEAASHIQGAFQSVLGRDASSADISFWQSQLGDGSATLATMIQQLANSPESYSRSPAVLAALEAMYQQVLGRGSDAGSLAYYQGEIANGVPVNQIRQVMAHSDEAASHIQGAFQSVLGRDASAADLSYWEGRLGDGSATLATMIQQLANSPESYSRSPAVLAALEAMYQQVLGRGSDAGSLAYYQGEIANGVPVNQIRQVMAHSDEAASHIQNAFQSTVGRNASPADISFWQSQLGGGSATLATMIQQLATSPESYSRSPAVLAALEAMYQQVFGRGSDAGSLAYIQGEIANGVPVDQIRQVMAHSDEAASHIQGAFQSVLGRDASAVDLSYWEGRLGDGSATLATMIQQLANSPEGYARSPAVAAALENIYQQVLGRASDPGSLAYKLSEIVNGVSLDQIRQETAHSDESVSHIQIAFQSILGRDASPADLSFWEGSLGNGSATLASMIQQLTTIAIQNDYSQILGRDATSAELASKENEYDAGSSIDQIRSEVGHSTEAAVNVRSAFLAYLGQDATPADIDYWETQLTNGNVTLASMAQLIKNAAPPVAPEVIATIRSDYAQILGRNPNAAELTDTENEYIAGSSFDQIRNELGHSTEVAGDIQSAFRTYLGRDAAQSDIDNWATQLTSGNITLAGLDQFLVSAGPAAPDVIAAIKADYQQILGRDPNATELAGKQIEFADGTSLDTVRSEIGRSFEAVSDIQTVFLTYLGRAATATDINYWESHFADGSVTLASMIQQFKAVQTPPTNDPTTNMPPGSVLPTINTGLLSEEAEIDELYREILGRPGEAQGIAGKELEIAAGTSWSTIRTEMAFSVEATQDIENLYEQILGRDATADELSSKQADLASGSTLDRTRSEIEHLPEALLLTGTNSGLVLKFTEHAWMGDAQFTISVDGVQAGGVYTSGSPFQGVNQIQAVIPDALLDVGSHTIQFTFINAADGGSPDADRTLSLLGAWLGGQQVSGSTQALLANGSASFGVTVDAGAVASLQSAAISSLYVEMIDREIDQTTIEVAESAISLGSSLGDVRDGFAHSNLAGQAIDTIYHQVLDRGATSAEVFAEESALSTGGTLLQFRRDLAVSGEVAAELTQIYFDVYNVNIDEALLSDLEAQIANGRLMADIRPSLAFTDTTRSTINQLYVDQVGRQGTGDEIVYWQARLANGDILGNVTDGNGASVAGTIAFYGITPPGEAPDYAVFQNVVRYENLTHDPAMDRSRGYAPENSPLTLVGSDGQPMAVTNARGLLALLPVYVTMNGGQSPNLKLPDGRLVMFNDTVVHGNVLDEGSNAEQLAGYLFRTAQHADSNDPLLASSYAQTIAWMEQVDQPALQAAVYYAVMSQMYTANGDGDRALEARTASALASQIASQNPSARSGSLTNVITAFGHPIEITVTDTGDASFHDIDNSSIVQILETVITIVVDILAITQPEVGIPLAIALHTAEAGQAFSDGNIIGGVLNLAAAAGAGFAYFGNTLVSESVIATSRAVGAGAQIVQGAENGDIASIVGGIITAASAVASGLDAAAISNGTEAAATSFSQLQATLAAAGALTSFGAAISKGDFEGALLNSLGPWLAGLAAQSLSDGTIRSDQLAGIPADTIDQQDVQPIDTSGKVVVFVGGFADQLAGNNSLVRAAADNYTGSASEYFSWDQKDELDAFIRRQTEPVIVVSHSYGADTAATVVANGAKVETLITLDPVSQVRPSYEAVSQNSGQWIDYNAVGGGIELSNLIAGVGGAWNTAPRDYADIFQNVDLSHGGIGGANFILRLLGERG